MFRRISDVPASIVLPRLAQLEPLPVAVAIHHLRLRAQQLQRELAEPLVRLRPVQLRHRSLRPRSTRLHQPRQRPVVRPLQRLELDPGLRDPVAEPIVELAAAGQVEQLADRDLERPRERKSEGRPLVHERRHRHLPALSGPADHVFGGDLDVGEEDLVELGLPRDLCQRPHLDTRRVHVDEEIRQPLVPRSIRVAQRDEDAPVGEVCVRRPDLLAVDHIPSILELGACPHRCEVGARTRLGEALAPDLLGRQDPGQVARLLLVCPVDDDRRPGHPEADHADVAGRL